MTPEEKLKRGREALLILENQVYKDAHAKIAQDIRSLRLALPPKDTEGAHKLVLMEQAVEKVKWLMEGYLYDSEVARKELEKEVPVTPIGRFNARFRR